MRGAKPKRWSIAVIGQGALDEGAEQQLAEDLGLVRLDEAGVHIVPHGVLDQADPDGLHHGGPLGEAHHRRAVDQQQAVGFLGLVGVEQSAGPVGQQGQLGQVQAAAVAVHVAGDVVHHRQTGGLEQVGLVLELVVDRALGQAGGGGHLIDRDVGIAVLSEQATGLGDQAVAVGAMGGVESG